MTKTELKDFFYSCGKHYLNGEDKGLGWCGCGEPYAALQFLGEVLEAFRVSLDERDPTETREESEARYLKPSRLCGAEGNPGLAYGYLYNLDAVGLTEHGSNVRGSWLTDKGHEVLQAIKSITSEEDWDSYDDD